MWNLVKAGRWLFGICLLGLAGQQFYFSDFRPVFVPSWPGHFPGEIVLVCLNNAMLIGCAVALLLERHARSAMLLLGGVFLILLLFCHIPYELVFDPYDKHIGAWANAFKDLAFAGGAFAMAGSFPDNPLATRRKMAMIRILELLIPMGSFFFSITMIVFGICHFLYLEYTASLVPGWIPGHMFWACFAGVALIGAGLGVMFRVRLKAVAILLGTMIFLWVILLHIPRAAMAPVADKGNELTSVFEALGFSGAAFVMAYGYTLTRIFPGAVAVL
ncbi:MAG: hypothetical protein JST42_23570 [Bacteroidetes bacterium]|nr:hypothetical protein [Bacteroidota bacterium]